MSLISECFNRVKWVRRQVHAFDDWHDATLQTSAPATCVSLAYFLRKSQRAGTAAATLAGTNPCATSISKSVYENWNYYLIDIGLCLFHLFISVTLYRCWCIGSATGGPGGHAPPPQESTGGFLCSIWTNLVFNTLIQNNVYYYWCLITKCIFST